jgi:hypothetical protein
MSFKGQEWASLTSQLKLHARRAAARPHRPALGSRIRHLNEHGTKRKDALPAVERLIRVAIKQNDIDVPTTPNGASIFAGLPEYDQVSPLFSRCQCSKGPLPRWGKGPRLNETNTNPIKNYPGNLS